MQYVTDMYGIYPAIKPEKNRERESVRKRRGEKGNNTEGNTREKKKWNSKQGRTRRGTKEQRKRKEETEWRSREHRQQKRSAPPSSSSLQNQVCALPFSIPVVKMMHASPWKTKRKRKKANTKIVILQLHSNSVLTFLLFARTSTNCVEGNLITFALFMHA